MLVAASRFSLVVASGGHSLVAGLQRLLIVVASSHGARAQLPHSMWDLPGPVIEPCALHCKVDS